MPRLSSEKQNNHSYNMSSSILKSRILVAPHWILKGLTMLLTILLTIVYIFTEYNIVKITKPFLGGFAWQKILHCVQNNFLYWIRFSKNCTMECLGSRQQEIWPCLWMVQCFSILTSGYCNHATSLWKKIL